MTWPKSIGFILGVVLVGFLFLIIFGNYIGGSSLPEVEGPQLKVKEVVDAAKTNENLANGSEIKNEELLSLNEQFDYLTKSTEESDNKVQTEITDNPLEKIAQDMNERIISSIAALNPGDPSSLEEFKLLNPDELTNKVILDQLEEMNGLAFDDLVNKLTINEALVFKATNVKDYEKYLSDLKSIFENNSLQTADFEIAALTYEKMFNDFNKIKVPTDLLSLHKKAQVIIKTDALIWRMINNNLYEGSPWLIILALRKQGDNEVNFNNLKNEILKMAAEKRIVFSWL